MTDFECIKRTCLKRGELWEDPDFPAVQVSVFYHQKPPFQFIWKRPKELCLQPIFVSDTSKLFDISPGKMGDKWLVSCLGVLFLSKGLFYRVVPADQTFFNADYAGIFRFRLWWCGEWTEVSVDDRLPTFNGRLLFLQAQHSDQFWPALLEKAYAKLHGSYEALKYGTLLDGLADMTGGITESISIKRDPITCGRMLSKLLDMTSLVTCIVQSSSTPQIRPLSEKLANGIRIDFNYRLYSLERVVNFNNEQIQLIKLRNPLQTLDEYKGAWSINSSEWTEIPSHEKERLGYERRMAGEFWISYTDFVKTFSHLKVVHMDNEICQDEPSLHHKYTWQMKIYPGAWIKGVTAGGCRNHSDTFHINPQINLIPGEMDDIIISLHQHNIMEPRVMGFMVYTLPKNVSDSVNRQFFEDNTSLTSSHYTNNRQISQRYQLEQGSYLILPTTYEPAYESTFTLRVYSCKPVKLKLLDKKPLLLKSPMIKAPVTYVNGKNFSQYESVFLQLADEHKTVNVFDLQELLDACLPNDYIKSCASLDVCRQIVITFNSAGNGRLKFDHFKDLMCSLKGWQTAFKNHTKEKTGILKAERLKDALLDVGFQLNVDVISILILRYMRKDGTLRFGDFVSSILHLTSAFSSFEERDLLQNGTIKLTLAEWLKSSLAC